MLDSHRNKGYFFYQFYFKSGQPVLESFQEMEDNMCMVYCQGGKKAMHKRTVPDQENNSWNMWFKMPLNHVFCILRKVECDQMKKLDVNENYVLI